jgi:transposase
MADWEIRIVSQNLFWLNDAQWECIQPHLPTDIRGKDRVDDRRVISGIIHVLKSGCRWCDCPRDYGPFTTVYNRFNRWAQRGIWDNVFLRLAQSSRSAHLQMIDSTHVKAHRSAAGGKGGIQSKRSVALGVEETRKFMHLRMLGGV